MCRRQYDHHPNTLIRGALNNGTTAEEIREVILLSAVYCGVPAAQEAFKAANEVLVSSSENSL